MLMPNKLFLTRLVHTSVPDWLFFPNWSRVLL